MSLECNCRRSYKQLCKKTTNLRCTKSWSQRTKASKQGRKVVNLWLNGFLLQRLLSKLWKQLKALKKVLIRFKSNPTSASDDVLFLGDQLVKCMCLCTYTHTIICIILSSYEFMKLHFGNKYIDQSIEI
jgi:hypothetical protein